MQRFPLIVTLLSVTLFMTGCGNRFWQDTKKTASSTYDYVFDTKPTARSYHETEQIPIIEINHQAADVLYFNVKSTELTSKSPIYVKTFTNQNNPGDNSIFGRVMTEQVVDRLVQRGLLITQGEPAAASPSAKSKADPTPIGVDKKQPPRAGRLEGQYVIGDNFIYLTAKIVRLDDSAIVSANNWTVPLSDNVRQMLPQLKLDDGLEPSVRTTFD